MENYYGSNEGKISDDLVRILDEVIEKISLADEGLLKTKVAEEFITNKIKEIDKILPDNSKIQLKYQKLKEDKNELLKWFSAPKSMFVPIDSSLYIELIAIKDMIQELLKNLDPLFNFEIISNQQNFYFSQGDEYDAKRVVLKIFKSAKQNIVIIDPYVDDTIFDYIEMIDKNLDIKVLTSTKTKKIVHELFQNIQSTKSNIMARQSNDFHDRYIIIDNKEIWHLGTSINSIGQKAFQINKFTEEKELTKMLDDFSIWWQNGRVII